MSFLFISSAHPAHRDFNFSSRSKDPHGKGERRTKVTNEIGRHFASCLLNYNTWRNKLLRLARELTRDSPSYYILTQKHGRIVRQSQADNSVRVPPYVHEYVKRFKMYNDWENYVHRIDVHAIKTKCDGTCPVEECYISLSISKSKLTIVNQIRNRIGQTVA
jgi:hypothetical protein